MTQVRTRDADPGFADPESHLSGSHLNELTESGSTESESIESGSTGSQTTSPASIERIRAAVLSWGEGRLRDLPWRRSRDPWEVLVSEIMLQQTQVARVLDRWTRFIERFPTAEACATAPLAAVLTEWQGLGYPRRARYLHLAAKQIGEAGFPEHLEGLLSLAGVGPYTARAVLAFAYEADAAVVDTNIARTLARLVGHQLNGREVQALADALLPPGEAWSWNQTLMDVGAVHCRPQPICDGCPLSAECVWRADQTVADPALATARVSKPQARFEGSDRQARGRLMAALAEGPVPVEEVAAIMDRPDEVIRRLVGDLTDERLCTQIGDTLILGDGS